MKAFLKRIIQRVGERLGFEFRRVRPPGVFAHSGLPDYKLYRPLFSPWAGEEKFTRYFQLAAPRTLVSVDRCYVLYALLNQAVNVPGDIWECGVYRGGTAAMMASILADLNAGKRLYLFDTFDGMPSTDPERDQHKQGDFSDTDANTVGAYVGHDDIAVIRKGLIPETFKGLEDSTVAMAHIDVDIYRSVLDCADFVWPRLSPGGFMIFDDYGFPSCPGARAAVDEFFKDEKAVPICLPTGQAIVFKGFA